MDSGNSGSMQSSSTGGNGGCDEEYDSRSAFFNDSNPTSHVGPMPIPPSLPSSSSTYLYHEVHDSSLFTNFFGHPSLSKPSSFNTNTNSFVNLDMLWSRNLRSDPNCTDLGNLMASSSSSRQQQPTFQDMQAAPTVQESDQRASVSASNEQNINICGSNSNVGRNSKKRSRASRRAPTTVLTTDTTNFRAMVQEFTGIPAPPFTSSFPRSRLDLFGTSSALRSGLGQFDASPSSSYLLRPFAQRVQPSSSSLFGSFKADAITSTTVTTTTQNNMSNTTIPQLGYQMPCDLEPQNLINTNMQNHVLNFQSFLQGPPRYPLSSTAILGSKQPQGSSSSLGIQTTDHSQLKNMGTLEDQFGRSIHGQVHPHDLGGVQTIVSSEGWRGDDGDRCLLRSINGGGYSSTSQGGVDVTNNGDNNKGPEDVIAPRSEGIVESWICSSD